MLVTENGLALAWLEVFPGRSSMGRFERFTDVIEQDERALRSLLRGEGDEPERVWAAWAIALRHGGHTSTLLADSVKGEPSAGVRAHLALMLVGQGERAAAIAIARRDPSASVRATALRCLARIATPADDELNELLAHALVREASAAVRAALLDGVRSDAPAGLRARVLDCIEDEDTDVRGGAIAFALRHRDEGEPFPAGLRVRAAREMDGELRARIFDAWIETDGLEGVVHSASSWATPQLLILLGRCETHDGPLSFRELAPLAALAAPRVDEWLAQLDEVGRIELPRTCLLELVNRYLRTSTGAWNAERAARYHAADLARMRLATVLDRTSRSALVDDEQRLIDELATRIERDAHELCEAAAVDVGLLLRRALGEPITAEKLALLSMPERDDEDEGDCLSVFGIELLPALRQLRSPA